MSLILLGLLGVTRYVREEITFLRDSRRAAYKSSKADIADLEKRLNERFAAMERRLPDHVLTFEERLRLMYPQAMNPVQSVTVQIHPQRVADSPPALRSEDKS